MSQEEGGYEKTHSSHRRYLDEKYCKKGFCKWTWTVCSCGFDLRMLWQTYECQAISYRASQACITVSMTRLSHPESTLDNSPCSTKPMSVKLTIASIVSQRKYLRIALSQRVSKADYYITKTAQRPRTLQQPSWQSRRSHASQTLCLRRGQVV